MKTYATVAAFLIYFAIVFYCVVAWIVNVVRFCQEDFDAPYRSEIIRGVAIVIPIVAPFVAFQDLED